VWFPIHDLHAPSLERATPLLDDLVGRIARGEHLLLHCAAGIGRTGTIAACILVRLGMDVDAALTLLREVRPGAGPEVGAQLDLVTAAAADPAG
jgi:atypical dual specificity phosphatase